MPGHRASSAAIASPTERARSSTRRSAPGNRRSSGGRQRHHHRPRRIGLPQHHGRRYASTTNVSTEEIAGRCCAMQVQLSPSSALANNEPELVPK